MEVTSKATRIRLFSIGTPQMRAFHMTWFAFFLCFFAWFGIAPLMKIVRDEMALTQSQIGWLVIGSVAITIVARLLIGWLCDRIGPRLAYTWLLLLGSLPVMGIGLAQDFQTFLVFRLLIGIIGASFVITQYHTSVMFAPNVVGTANATTAGWGNLGGGVTQLVMPIVLGILTVGAYIPFTDIRFLPGLGLSDEVGWRAAMVIAGAMCALVGVAYWFLTQDAPEGNYRELRAAGKLPPKQSVKGSFATASKDPRVWALFVIYGACFGIELTVNNVLALYFIDYFDFFASMSAVQAVQWAGAAAMLFGLMNVFARTLGGAVGDLFGRRWGLSGRVRWLFIALFAEGLALMLFSQMPVLALAIPALIVFSLCVQMSEGATYSVVPFINRKALGSVAGIVGAGGNAGAVAAGFLFRGAIPVADGVPRHRRAGDGHRLPRLRGALRQRVGDRGADGARCGARGQAGRTRRRRRGRAGRGCRVAEPPGSGNGVCADEGRAGADRPAPRRNNGRTGRQERTMVNPAEVWKSKKHSFDVWPDVLRHAEARTPMGDIETPDLERMKWYGFFYRKRDTPGRYMNRIRITAGELTSDQAREIAAIAYEHGHGIVDVTTRANLQVQGLGIERLPEVAERLAAVGLTAKQTGHDNIRNVFAHPFSGLLRDELIDTRQLCRDVTALFVDSREYSDLPRKFNICLNGTAEHSVHFWTQDLSFLARRVGREILFQVLMAGTQGQNPHLAWHLPVLVHPDQVVAVTAALLDLFRARGVARETAPGAAALPGGADRHRCRQGLGRRAGAAPSLAGCAGPVAGRPRRRPGRMVPAGAAGSLDHGSLRAAGAIELAAVGGARRARGALG